MPSIGSFRAIQLLDFVDENGYLKTYSRLSDSNDLLFVNSLSASSSWDLDKKSGIINNNYYQIGMTYSY